MKLKRILLTLFLSIGLSAVSTAGYLDDWPDDALCGWMENPSPPAHIVAEVKKRGISCEGGKAVKGLAKTTTTKKTTSTNKSNTSTKSKTLTKSPAITIYDVEFSASVLKELLDKIASKTDYDFSQHNLASNPKDIQCTFNLRRVVYDYSVEGKIENWNIAQGSLLIADGKVIINDKSYWQMGGLSTDKTYLKDEVNIRLTEDGHFVGRMAYFILNTEQGEVAIKPKYPRLKKHKKSKPLNINSPRKAEFWIDFEDEDDQWSGGVLFLSNCKQIATSISETTKVATSDDDPTVSKVIEVIQGDKFIVDIAEPHELAGSNINLVLRDIDAPDAIRSCPKQMELGTKVKDIVTQKLADSTSIKLKNIRKTSKAVIAQVIVDGKDLGEELVTKGYASKEFGYWQAYFCSALTATQAGMQLFDVDRDKAIFWFERAIVLDPDGSNNTKSAYLLSELYSLMGNDNKSLEYLKKSASLGWMKAEEDLGIAYLEGYGVSPDKSEAKYWLKKAHEHGSKIAEDTYCSSLPVAKQEACKF